MLITTLVASFCKDGEVSVNVNLWFLVVCVWCDVLCHFVVAGNEYDQMNSIMTLLKPLSNPSLLIPYKQYYIQTLHREGKLIPEQYPGEINPLFQTAINPQPPHTT